MLLSVDGIKQRWREREEIGTNNICVRNIDCVVQNCQFSCPPIIYACRIVVTAQCQKVILKRYRLKVGLQGPNLDQRKDPMIVKQSQDLDPFPPAQRQRIETENKRWHKLVGLNRESQSRLTVPLWVDSKPFENSSSWRPLAHLAPLSALADIPNRHGAPDSPRQCHQESVAEAGQKTEIRNGRARNLFDIVMILWMWHGVAFDRVRPAFSKGIGVGSGLDQVFKREVVGLCANERVPRRDDKVLASIGPDDSEARNNV